MKRENFSRFSYGEGGATISHAQNIFARRERANPNEIEKLWKGKSKIAREDIKLFAKAKNFRIVNFPGEVSPGFFHVKGVTEGE